MSNESTQSSAIGQTSEEMAPPKKSSGPLGFGLFDLCSLLALIMVTAASVLLFWELSDYGNVLNLDYPWSVAGEKAAPVVAPAD